MCDAWLKAPVWANMWTRLISLLPHFFAHYPAVQQVTTSAFSSVQGETYSFAVAYTGDLVLYALNPYNGMLSPRPVTAGSVRRVYTSLCFSPDGQW